MSPTTEDAHAQWLEQLASMRNTIAELNLPAHKHHHAPPAYGHDMQLDDDDLSGTSSEDIWDIISDDCQDAYSSDQLEHILPSQPGANVYDQQWLSQQCRAVARSSSGLESDVLKDQIAAILASDSNGKSQTCVKSSTAS